MARAFLTYAWADNDQRDVDFVAGQLRAAGLEVLQDKLVFHAGQHLWPQIDAAIADPGTNGWIIYATPTSLSRPACIEEYALALDQALHRKGSSFPLIALSNAHLDRSIMPGPLRTRLCVSTVDTDWIERVKASVEGRAPAISTANIDPFFVQFHSLPEGLFFEARPRAGVWHEPLIAVPIEERNRFATFYVGTSGSPLGNFTTGYSEVARDQGDIFGYAASNQATPTTSVYARFTSWPTRIHFGDMRSGQIYVGAQP